MVVRRVCCGVVLRRVSYGMVWVMGWDESGDDVWLLGVVSRRNVSGRLGVGVGRLFSWFHVRIDDAVEVALLRS